MSRTDATLEQNTRWHDEGLSKHGAYARDHLIAHARMVIEQGWRGADANRPLRYRATWQMNEPRLPQERVTLRVEIHWETHYPQQSYIRVERFDGAQWRQVHSIPAELVEELSGASYGRAPITPAELQLLRETAAEALLQACQVLSLLEIVNHAVYFNAGKGRVVGLIEPLPDDDDA